MNQSRTKKYAKRILMDCRRLVNLIRDCPLIWDIRHSQHNNRLALNESWDMIAHGMGHNRDECRKKWKYIKDQLRKEIRKEMQIGPHFVSIWELYDELGFIKPQFEALLISHEEDTKDSFIIENNPIVVLHEEPDVQDLTMEDDNFEDSSADYDEDDEDTEHDSDKEGSEKQMFSSSIQSYQEKKEDVDTDSGVEMSKNVPAAKRIKLNSPDFQNEDTDSDNFFKSLLPFMRQLNSIQKLRVRNTIQNVILHELELIHSENADFGYD